MGADGPGVLQAGRVAQAAHAIPDGREPFGERPADDLAAGHPLDAGEGLDAGLELGVEADADVRAGHG